MLAFLGIFAFFVMMWNFFMKGNLKASFQTINSKEFLVAIPNFSEKLVKTNPTLATIDFDFDSRNWSAALKYSVSSGSVVLTVKDKTLNYKSPTNSEKEVFLSIAIVKSKGQHVFYWYNINLSDPYTEKNIWNGPSSDYCLKNKDLIFPDDVLTLFIRISTYSLPFSITAENYHAYSKDNKDDNKGDKSKEEGMDRRLCLDCKGYNKDDNKEDKSKEEGMDKRKCLDCKVLKNLSKNLKDLYLDEKDPDVEITVRNVTLKAHRAILKARSPVMTAMLSENVSKIEEDIRDPQNFVTFLHFLYSGTVDKLDNENALSVYMIANKYEIPDLKEVCAKYMVSSLTVNSVSNVISLALKYEDDKLLENATDFFLKNAVNIFPTDEWRIFLKENPTKANELVINSYLNLKSS